MNENGIQLAMLEHVRGRLLASLEAIEGSGMNVAESLKFRPGPGRAHIAWQAMHCAATHDKYVNVFLRGAKIKDESLVAAYGVNSVPSDTNVPDLKTIRETLDFHYWGLLDFVRGETNFDRQVVTGGGKVRSVRESLFVMAWHESHHQGQIHLTWNILKAR
jgi:uncharacterized damage-inducible protein DinB